MRHCVFCRSVAHVSKDCPVAPACKSCASTSHASQHCPGRRLVSSPQGTPESRPAQASERHEIALEPHWFRVQTERIKRSSTVTKAPPASKSIPAPPAPDRASKTKKRQVDPDQDLAAQPQDPSNRAQPEPLSETPRPEFSFNFPPNSAPLPASNQGTAPPLVEKSSESPSSEKTPPPPSPPPATPTPKTIVTRSQSIAVLSTPATREDPLTTPASEASEPTPRPSSPLPSAAPKARPDATDADEDADEEAKDQEAPPEDIPNVSFVAANVQSINEDRKRASLFSNLRSHNDDVFLLSETGRPSPERVAQWTQECQDLKLSALFTPLNNTAILWKSDSVVITFDPESPPNTLCASFSFPDCKAAPP
ncbi:BQ5605_C043g12066 [Microbotryum silenes-dioicae]|uniref:BQ5605_C043g12066 protein n=1 Tax=Microbotryum silenes-dioicae TaxID=796604 RepID=A0A2X0MQJ4_9BASI|nr:BQ5605_C043g12066 [Microbotryum silenes-dioicae]